MIKRCKQCDLPFHPQTKNHLYCKKCQRKGIKYYKPTAIKIKVCPICMTKFSSGISSHIYCSRECREKADKRKLAKVEKKCAQCGEMFLTARKNKKYCSTECYKEHKSQEAKREYRISRSKRK